MKTLIIMVIVSLLLGWFTFKNYEKHYQESMRYAGETLEVE